MVRVTTECMGCTIGWAPPMKYLRVIVRGCDTECREEIVCFSSF
jgi:hypothetical protein